MNKTNSRNSSSYMTGADQMLYIVAKIEAYHSGGIRKGTGFWFKYKRMYPYLVTNRHVVESCTRLDLSIPVRYGKSRIPSELYKKEILCTQTDWIYPEDETIDLAILPIPHLSQEIREQRGVPLIFLDHNFLPTHQDIEKMDSVEDVIFVGYPEGLTDVSTALPVFRKGMTATPYWLNLHGRPQFLLDASVFPGSSGSPVFIYNTGISYERGVGNIVGGRGFFLGILTVRFLKPNLSEIGENQSKMNDTSLKESIDLGLVYKPEIIIETCRAHIEKIGFQ